MGILVTNETIVKRETIGENFEINGYRRNRTKGVRLDSTHFDGENPLGWLLRLSSILNFTKKPLPIDCLWLLIIGWESLYMVSRSC